MDRKPFEIVAECEMAGFPTGADVERLNERIGAVRRSRPNVVQAVVSPPAIFRERRYVLQARFVVWAEDGVGATQAVEGIFKDAGVACRMVLPSGRALTGLAVPPAPELVKSAPPTKSGRPRGKKPHGRPAKPGRRAARSGAAATPKAGAGRGRVQARKGAARRRGAAPR